MPLCFHIPHRLTLPAVQVAGLTVGEEHNSHFVSMYVIFIQQLQVILPQWGAIPSAYEQGSDEEQGFIQNLALFFTAFFKVIVALYMLALDLATQF